MCERKTKEGKQKLEAMEAVRHERTPEAEAIKDKYFAYLAMFPTRREKYEAPLEASESAYLPEDVPRTRSKVAALRKKTNRREAEVRRNTKLNAI